MRVLVIGDAGAHTGFGTVVHNIFERVAAKGHDIHVLAANYKGDSWDTNLKLYVPNFDERQDILGRHRIVRLMADLMPDALFFVNDPSVVLGFLASNPWDPERVVWRGMKAGQFAIKPPILAYLPIDGYNSPKMWDALLDRPVTRIAMSHFGQQQMPEAPVVWHGVDTSVFRPRDKAEAKRELGFDPDRFLILRVDKNSQRKDYASTWKALRPVLRAHPDIDVHFHCHANAGEGYNLDAIRFGDEDIRDRVTFTADLGGFIGWPIERLATLYAAADLFTSQSWGEGFGLTVLESMASGTAVLVSDHTTMPEVVGDAGIRIKPAGRITVNMGQEMCLPDVPKFSYWIEHLYNSRKIREGLAKAGVTRAQQFSWDIAADKFEALIRREVTNAVQRGELPPESDPSEVRAAV